jgi:hypothetical protein
VPGELARLRLAPIAFFLCCPSSWLARIRMRRRASRRGCHGLPESRRHRGHLGAPSGRGRYDDGAERAAVGRASIRRGHRRVPLPDR